MNFNSLVKIFLGFFITGVSVGYILGFFISLNLKNINLSYLSILFLVAGIFLLIYGSLFQGENGDKKKYN
tara:strand:+ start:324 stop:533 length:210 start_codon:yes stop_codon:yes gene_type:complete